MPRGGKREGAGAKKLRPEAPAAAPTKDLATQILSSLGMDVPPWHKGKTKAEVEKCLCEPCLWKRDAESTQSDGRWSRDRLWSQRNGNPVTTVNHVHDKPLEMNVNVSIAEIVRKVRERKIQYERSRK